MGKNRLSMEVWRNIFRNTKDMGEEVETVWLDNVGKPSEWGLHCGDELFEDGFETEKEAQDRLDYLENEYHYYNKALLFAEKHGIIEYQVAGHIMTYIENFPSESYKCMVNLNTMKEDRELL